jgi:hypothetical protein
MALCIVNSGGVLQVSTTETETTCTSYILVSADQYRLSSGIFSGVTLPDVIETSFLVVLAWAMAWGVVVLRRAL